MGSMETKNMRILVDIRHLSRPNPTGISEYTIQLLHALNKIDKHNEYILFSSGRIKPNLSALNLQPFENRAFHISTPNKILNFRTFFFHHPTINWYLRDPVDLIFLPNLNITELPTDIPTVLTIHDMSWQLYPEFYSMKMRLWHKAVRANDLVAKCKKIIVPSLSTKEDVKRLLNAEEEKIKVIHHGISESYTTQMQSKDHGVRSRYKLPKRFALFVGTIEPRKNLLALIEGVKEYRDLTHDNLHLVIAGNWGWKSLPVRRRLWKQDANEWIHHVGYVRKDELPALYRSATITVWPSIYEGFGLPILESMASGTPVITSNTSSIPEVARSSAILIDPYNSRDITDALRCVLGSAMLEQKLIAGGIENAKWFNWEKTARETLDVFNQIPN